MSRRFLELVIRARRLVGPVRSRVRPGQGRITAHRQVGGELTQFSFRLAFMIDLIYVGLGAMGGAALGRGVVDSTAAPPIAGMRCWSDSPTDHRSATPPVPSDSASARTGIRPLQVDSTVIPRSIR